MKIKNITFLNSFIIGIIFCFTAIDSPTFAGSPSLQFQMVLSSQSISGGEKFKIKIETDRTREASKSEIVFNLETNQANLVKLPSEMKIKAGDNSVTVEVATNPTPIKTNLEIKATLQEEPRTQALQIIELVPARLKSVTANRTSIVGTIGSQIDFTVELRAAAPTGGIQLYFSPVYVGNLKGVSLPTPNLQISGGETKFSFQIKYQDIQMDGVSVASVDSFSPFNIQKRTIEFTVATEPQTSTPKWQTITGVAIPAKFDVLPLQISTISVQPLAVTGGGESLGSFTLNHPPGTSESIYFRPNRTSISKFWIRPVSSSCQESSTINLPVEIPLTQGVTTYNFKVCTDSVTSPMSGKIEAILRSGKKETAIMIQP